MINSGREVKREMTLGASTKIVVGTKDELYYSGSVNESEAKALGESLRAIGFLRDGGAMVEFSRSAEGTVIAFVSKKEIWNQPDMVSNFQEVVRQVAPSAGGLPIRLRFLNMAHETQKEVTVT